MKNAIRVWLLCWPLLAFAGPGETRVKSNIEDVTVYLQGAQIERLSNVVNIPAGTSELVFTDIAQRIDPSSIRIKGDGSFTILSVNHRYNFDAQQAQNQEIEELNRRIEEKQYEIERLNTELSALNEEWNLMMENKAFKGENVSVSKTQLQEMTAFYRGHLKEIALLKLEQNNRIEQAEEALVALQNDLSQRQAESAEVSSEILVTVSSTAPAQSRFYLQYFSPDAGWLPAYDIRVNTLTLPVDVMQRARVYQATGVDWNNVQLTLSSGNPALGGTKPTLNPYYLSYESGGYGGGYSSSGSSTQVNRNYGTYNPSVRKVEGVVLDDSGEPLPFCNVLFPGTSIGTITDFDGNFTIDVPPGQENIQFSYVGMETLIVPVYASTMRITLESSEMLMETVVVASAKLVPGVSNDKSYRWKEQFVSLPPPVEQKYRATSFTYALNKPYSIPSTGKHQNIELQEQKVDALFRYATVPKLDASAFLTAQIPGWNQYDFLSGEASIFFEGTLIGKTSLVSDITVDTLALSLGRDQGIIIERTLVSEMNKKKALSSKQIIEREWEITLRNNKQGAVSVVVEDQVPVSREGNIEVEVGQLGKTLSYDEETGLVKWLVTLAPGQTEAFRFSYKVTYPKFKKIPVY